MLAFEKDAFEHHLFDGRFFVKPKMIICAYKQNINGKIEFFIAFEEVFQPKWNYLFVFLMNILEGS